jgi:hypothetical protein
VTSKRLDQCIQELIDAPQESHDVAFVNPCATKQEDEYDDTTRPTRIEKIALRDDEAGPLEGLWQNPMLSRLEFDEVIARSTR